MWDRRRCSSSGRSSYWIAPAEREKERREWDTGERLRCADKTFSTTCSMWIINQERRVLWQTGSSWTSAWNASSCCWTSLMEEASSNLGSSSLVKMFSGSSLQSMIWHVNGFCSVNKGHDYSPEILLEKASYNWWVDIDEWDIFSIIVCSAQLDHARFQAWATVNPFVQQTYFAEWIAVRHDMVKWNKQTFHRPCSSM